VGVVTVSKDPADLPTWLRYHLNYAGVDHIFLQMEETSWLPKLLESQPAELKNKVSAWVGEAGGKEDADGRPQHNYQTLQERQMKAMDKAKYMAQDEGLDWLFHIDDDELLHVPTHVPLGEVLAAIPSQFSQGVVPNFEAVYPSPKVEKCFIEAAEVNLNVFSFASYYNGKPVMRLSDTDLFPLGPHRWRTSSGMEPLTYEFDQQVPFGPSVMLLHFESCPFQKWEHKFWHLSSTTAAEIKDIPFPFYRKSIERMQHCAPYVRAKDFAPVPGEPQECTPEAFQMLWAGQKTRQNSHITDQDILPIDIPWKKILAK